MVINWLTESQPATFASMSKVTGLDSCTQEQMGIANSLRQGTYPSAIGVELQEFSKGYQLLHCYIGSQFLPQQKEAQQLAGEAIAKQLNRAKQPIFSFRLHFSGNLSVMLYTHEVENELLHKLQSLRQSLREYTSLPNLQLYLIDGNSAYQIPDP